MKPAASCETTPADTTPVTKRPRLFREVIADASLPDGPRTVPDYRLMEQDFIAQMPHMKSRVLVLDRAQEIYLDWAIERALNRGGTHVPDRALAHALREQLDAEERDSIMAYFRDGKAFAFSEQLPGRPQFHLIQPFQFDNGLHSPEARGAGTLPWHHALSPLSTAREQASALISGWHEFGHAAFAEHRLAVSLSRRIGGFRRSTTLDETMLEQAEETFCDYYAIGGLIRDIRGRTQVSLVKSLELSAIDPIRDLIHARIVNSVAGMAVNGWGIRNLPRSDWRRVLVKFSEPRANLDHPGLIDTAFRQTLDGQPDRQRFGRHITAFWQLKQHAHMPERFLAALGRLGADTRIADSYVLCRDYLEVLNQQLPANQPLQPLIDAARQALSHNPRANDWDRRYPSVEASLISLQRRLRKTAAPAPRPGLRLGF